MVDNIQGSEYIANRQISKQTLEALMNSKKLQNNNPYASMPSILDQTEISNEAIQLFEQESEVEQYLNLLKQMPDLNENKIAAIKAQFESGTYELPTDDELASALLGDSDFKSLLGL